MNIIPFYLPLGGKSYWGQDDLKYLLRSLEDNVKCDFTVTVYGDEQHKPKWLTGVEWEDIGEFYPEILLEKNFGVKDYQTFFDTANKLQIYVNKPDTPERFVYLTDDLCLLKEINSIEDIPNVPLNKVVNYPDVGKLRIGKHGHTIVQALNIANMFNGGNKALWNWDNHYPRVYETRKLKEMFNRCPLESQEIPYSVSTLYFNLYGETPKDMIQEHNVCRALFHGDISESDASPSDTLEQIKEAVKDKICLNYSDAGLTQALMQFIEDRFQDKSRFEL